MFRRSTAPPARAFGLWTAVVLSHFHVSESTRCLKRDEIENRDGNVYHCVDPSRPVCCEIGRSFTCCEEAWTKAVRNQMWVFLLVALLVVFALFLCSFCRGQIQVFRAPTVQQAYHGWKGRILNKLPAEKGNSQFDPPYEKQPTNGY